MTQQNQRRQDFFGTRFVFPSILEILVLDAKDPRGDKLNLDNENWSTVPIRSESIA